MRTSPTKTLLLVTTLMLLPFTVSAAIQLDFMDEPWALSERAREELVNKLKEIDFEGLKDDLDEVVENLPDEVKELPGQAIDKFEEEGIDIEGTGKGIWNVFSNFGKWMVKSLTQFFVSDSE